MVTVRQLLETELAWANARYEEVQFLPSTAKDFLAVAEVGGEKVGLGRLVAVDDTTGELGGMYVLPAYSPYQQLFCIPFAHLESFYAGFGFSPVPA